MKKLKFLFVIGIILTLSLQTATAFASTSFSDGVYTFVKTENNNALITDCNLTQKTIEVPGSVLGYPVEGIGGYAFFSNSYIREVTLPPAVISIGEYAFAGNEALESVTIPRWCETIADNAFWNSPNVIIKCLYDSKAFTYAAEKGIACELLDGINLGDANGDGSIDINDVTVLQRYVAELENLDGIRFLAADINCDEDVDISDATEIQSYLAEFEIQYPIGQPIQKKFS